MASCTDRDEDMGSTDDSTKRLQLNPPKSDRLRIAGTGFMLAFDWHIGFHMNMGLPKVFRSWVMWVQVQFLIWVPM